MMSAAQVQVVRDPFPQSNIKGKGSSIYAKLVIGGYVYDYL